MQNYSVDDTHRMFMKAAFTEAKKSFEEGGLPIGCVLVKDKETISSGHNKRVQDGNPIAHGEIDCLKNAGRQKNYRGTTLYTTLSPCEMCSGAILLFGIKNVVVGENKNFPGNIGYLREKGVEVIVMDDEDSFELMNGFIRENPDIWSEDIGGGNGRKEMDAQSI